VVFRTQAVARAAVDLSRIADDANGRDAKRNKKALMLRTSSFFGPLKSGFVPFSSAAPSDALVDADPTAPSAAEAEAEAEAAEVVARAAAAPAVEPLAFQTRPAWAPASSARIRVVEGAVLVAICGYFAFGLLRTLAGM
jgi:hypothetical protein